MRIEDKKSNQGNPSVIRSLVALRESSAWRAAQSIHQSRSRQGMAMTYSPGAIVRELEILMIANPRIRISTIASLIGVGRHTIEKAVRARKQMSFREYQRRELLRKAQLLLEDSGLSVREIGARLGYDTLSSFSRFLHRSTGRSPRQFRRELKVTANPKTK